MVELKNTSFSTPPSIKKERGKLMNIILGIINIIVTFSLLILVERIFKREGLYIWICMSTIVANILVCKSITLLGFTTNLGNVMFGSIFLASDIMSEKYGYEDSRKAAMLGATSQVLFMIIMALALPYIPSEVDFGQESMMTLFPVNIRIGIVSVLMYLASSLLDIQIFKKIKQRFPKFLWLRNNVSTIISSCLQNYLFTFLAFSGIYDIMTMCTAANVASVLEIIISLAGTPFIYLSKKWIFEPKKIS